MRVIDAQFEPLPNGGILYDAAQMRNPTASLFVPDFWAARGALREISGGRGSVCFIQPGELSLLPAALGGWVLRHYHRGGMAAKLLRDRYLWTAAEHTRCFREWRLLAELFRRGLPVPAPVAAMYAREGLNYRADLITVELPAAQTLAAAIIGPLSQQQWAAIGRTIATFHAHGVHHADLNAHNILLASGDNVFLLDFDRGCIRERGAWEQRVLQRLRRSLEKISTQLPHAAFGETQWGWLVGGMADGKVAGKAVGCRL